MGDLTIRMLLPCTESLAANSISPAYA